MYTSRLFISRIIQSPLDYIPIIFQAGILSSGSLSIILTGTFQ